MVLASSEAAGGAGYDGVNVAGRNRLAGSRDQLDESALQRLAGDAGDLTFERDRRLRRSLRLADGEACERE
jgi:hypothetical protein